MPIKHQLNIHLDYGPHCFEAGGLEIRYGYHYSGVHELREQVIRVSAVDISPPLSADLTEIYGSLRKRIPASETVRLPHVSVQPEIETGGLTFVVLDQARATLVPFARLYYYEVVAPLKSRVEREVRVDKSGWTDTESVVCARIQDAVRKLAWQDYERLMGHHVLGADKNDA
jgi:hypothetical protein